MESKEKRSPNPGGSVGSHSLPTILPSGRKIVLQVKQDGEVLELHSPTGEIELAIEITENGPTLRLRGATLVLDSAGSVAVNCRDLSIQTTEGIELSAGADLQMRSQEDIRVKSAKQTFIDGDYVNLNCLERTGYHDEGMEEEAEVPSLPEESTASAESTAEPTTSKES